MYVGLNVLFLFYRLRCFRNLWEVYQIKDLMSSVEEGELLCLQLMVWRRVLLLLWDSCRFMWVQQGVEGSGVDVRVVFYDLSLAVLGWSL